MASGTDSVSNMEKNAKSESNDNAEENSDVFRPSNDNTIMSLTASQEAKVKNAIESGNDITASQEKRIDGALYDSMIEKGFRGMNKETFIHKLCADMGNDASLINDVREGLFELVSVYHKSAPKGKLIARRKNSYKVGGISNTEKLSDDIYNIFQYLEGDTSIDLKKLLSANSIRFQNSGNSDGVDTQHSDDTSMNELTLRAHLNELTAKITNLEENVWAETRLKVSTLENENRALNNIKTARLIPKRTAKCVRRIQRPGLPSTTNNS